ncbi:hypothetical protein GF366_02940 [Candidatus Peregrinibacteria bacterium]|nr:hypothetical protein [Candidatus Peregrinibacteria bacterium]
MAFGVRKSFDRFEKKLDRNSMGFEERLDHVEYDSWILPPESENVIRDLIRRSNEGDRNAANHIVRCCGKIIIGLARRFSNNNPEIFYDLINDGIEKTYECIFHFDCNNGESTFPTYLYRALVRIYIVKYSQYNLGHSVRQAQQTHNTRLEIKRRIKEVQDPFDELSIEEIHQRSGLTRGRIFRAINGSRYVGSIEQKPKTTNGREVDGQDLKRNRLKDVKLDVEELFLQRELDEILKRILGELDLSSQIIIRQYFGFDHFTPPLSVEQVQEISRDPNILVKIKTAVENLKSLISEFCENPYKTVSEVNLQKLKQLLNSENEEFEASLKGIADAELRGIIQTIIKNAVDDGSIELEETVYLTEIFDIPPLSRHTFTSISKLFGVSRQTIGLKMKNKLLPLLKRELRNKYNINNAYNDTPQRTQHDPYIYSDIS